MRTVTTYETEMTEMQITMMGHLDTVEVEKLEEVYDDGVVVAHKVRVTEISDANNKLQ
jgi:hypothetical protein